MKRSRRTLLFGIVAVSILGFLMQMVVLQRVGTEAGKEIGAVLGEERYRQITQQAQSPATTVAQMQTLAGNVASEIAAKIDAMPPAEQMPYILSLLGVAAKDLALVLVLFLPLLLLLAVWTRAFFLGAALYPAEEFRSLAGRATQAFLPLLCVYVCAALASGVWLPFVLIVLGFWVPGLAFLGFVSLLVPLYLGPRVALAPALFLKGGGVAGSVRGSFRLTAHRWGMVLGRLIAAAAVAVFFLWIGQTAIDLLMALLAFPAVALFLLWIRQAFSYGAVAYRTIFLAELTTALEKR
jgi:hypothetical protein